MKIYLLESDEPVAALQGIVEPALLLSRGLVVKLDDAELDAVIAHEYAHFIYGGNLRLLWIWIVRAFQAFNPAALVVFRTLTEMRELSCDALAVCVTQKPATLCSAILKVYDAADLTDAEKAGVLNRTRNEILRHAEAVSIRIRVRTLLDYPGERIAKNWQRWAGFVVMGGIVWAIG